MRVALAAVIGLAATAPRVWADPDPDPADAVARCAQAKAYAKHGDLTRARLLVDVCPDDDPAHVAIARALDDKGYSMISIVTKPDGVAVAIDARPDLALAGGAEVWLPAGTYTFSAGGMASTVIVKRGAHAVVLLEVPGATPDPHNGAIDFGDEGGGEVVNGPPPKIVHPSLLPDRYQKIVDVKGGGGDFIDEHAEPAPDPDRARLGFAVGAADTASHAGFSVAAVARYSILQAEAAWLRRGDRYDALAVPVLVRGRILTTDAIVVGVAVGGQGELRFGDGVGRAGASVIGGVDGELRDLGVVVDLRGEYGQTWTVGVRAGLLF